MGAKVLVVEDDKYIRGNMKLLLESEGYNVDCVENGQLALNYLSAATELPSLIILDLMMPVMDGFEFRAVQEKDPRFTGIPIIIMTADGHTDEKQMRIGAAGALRKPADIDAILDLVKQFCH